MVILFFLQQHFTHLTNHLPHWVVVRDVPWLSLMTVVLELSISKIHTECIWLLRHDIPVKKKSNFVLANTEPELTNPMTVSIFATAQKYIFSVHQITSSDRKFFKFFFLAKAKSKNTVQNTPKHYFRWINFYLFFESIVHCIVHCQFPFLNEDWYPLSTVSTLQPSLSYLPLHPWEI